MLAILIVVSIIVLLLVLCCTISEVLFEQAAQQQAAIRAREVRLMRERAAENDARWYKAGGTRD